MLDKLFNKVYCHLKSYCNEIVNDKLIKYINRNYILDQVNPENYA